MKTVFVSTTILLLIASYIDERERKTYLFLPAAIYLIGLISAALLPHITLGNHFGMYFTGLAVSTLIEKTGFWTRGDTWIYTATHSTLPATTKIVNNPVPTAAIILAATFGASALINRYYKTPAPGIHSQTAAYITAAALHIAT